MADWFKLDAHIFSDAKVRFCIASHRDALAVYIWCLSQCCLERSDRFKWDGSEEGLIGLASLLNIEDEEIQMALRVICESKLISEADGHIVVRNWEKHQSEYLTRKAYFAERYKKSSESASPKSTVKHSEAQCSTVKHSEALLEERRREESTEYTHSEDVRRSEPPPSPSVESATPEACVLAEKPENPNGKARELFELQQRTEWLKAEIGKIYRRPDGCNWVHDEETLLCEVARRPASKSEYREIAAYRGRLAPQDRRFFPQSIRSLLTGWDATLDKARVHVDTTPKTIADKIVDDNVKAAKKTIEYLNRYEASNSIP